GLPGGCIRVAQAGVPPRQMIMHVSLVGIEGGPLLEFRCRLGELALLLEEDAELIMALPLVAFQPNRSAQQLLRPSRVSAARQQALRVNELRQWIAGIRSRPFLKARDDVTEAIVCLIQHLT